MKFGVYRVRLGKIDEVIFYRYLLQEDDVMITFGVYDVSCKLRNKG